MEDITQRQTEILKVIIKEYTETGEPVGSEILEKNINLVYRQPPYETRWFYLPKMAISKKLIFHQVVSHQPKAFAFT